MTKWAIDLGEHDIDYKRRFGIKGQDLANFLIEIPEDQAQTVTHMKETQMLAPDRTFIIDEEEKEWILHTNRALSKDASGAGIILVIPHGDKLTYALRFDTTYQYGFACRLSIGTKYEHPKNKGIFRFYVVRHSNL
uniref:Uncharacterized protein n=1 Tax=Lactuca sativa TaxID=4236 RepID=A0A9R1X9T1_LACSA|nr:hypothetical protein LSAT_V11C500263840 [Lactuca sativa]